MGWRFTGATARATAAAGCAKARGKTRPGSDRLSSPWTCKCVVRRVPGSPRMECTCGPACPASGIQVRCGVSPQVESTSPIPMPSKPIAPSRGTSSKCKRRGASLSRSSREAPSPGGIHQARGSGAGRLSRGRIERRASVRRTGRVPHKLLRRRGPIARRAVEQLEGICVLHKRVTGEG